MQAIATNSDAENITTSQIDQETIENEVKILLNVIASVKFNESLYDAVNINMLYTKKIIEISKGIQNLESLVLTLHSNYNQRDEKL